MMDFTRITALQKRIVEWRRSLLSGQLAPSDASELTALTESLHALLYNAWDKGELDADGSLRLESLERQLNTLFERSRYATLKGPGSKDIIL